MPTYRNDGSSNITIKDANGNEKVLEPGGITTTNKYYDLTDLTKTADTPYLNIIAAYTILTFSASETQTITLSSPNIAKIRIQKADGDFDIFLESESNTPALLKNWGSTDQPIDIAIDGLCDKIAVTSNSATGTIHVVEMNIR